ncbi:hypothetical protein Nepgr_024745 [Nepenthes gracilis]|uniref:Uncharacterized protein n=1 Tax=Nepenthes gracilis TaxID=150966 RepID=A0AAD3XYX1_NEPGR|nr:hypothetical protein Nepgr_024745 [Nepenthes gracilis]
MGSLIWMKLRFSLCHRVSLPMGCRSFRFGVAFLLDMVERRYILRRRLVVLIWTDFMSGLKQNAPRFADCMMCCCGPSVHDLTHVSVVYFG